MSTRFGGQLRCSGFLGLALLLACLTPPSRALACVVGNGTGASCTEAALTACLPGGGSVTFNCGGAATITVTSTQTISADTTIDGGGVITISGGNSVGVFSVNAGVNFTVQNLTIANGNGNNASNFFGGGIFNDAGTLTVTNSTFSNNHAGGSGGGVYSGGPLTVTNSTFSDNTAGGCGCNGNGLGSGIYSGDTATVTNSTFSGNYATYSGGAIYSTFTLTVTNSTFSGNTAYYSDGGGIYSSDTLTVTNSTFSGNHADWFGSVGGGIYSGGSLTVTNSTFSGNWAASGGGIYNNSDTVTVTNTIVANSPGGGNCSGPVTDGGHNIDDGTTCGFTGTGCTSTSGSSFCNTNPLLEPAGLADNGGPTLTLAIEPNSPAVNAGDESVCSTTTGTAPVDNLDQRGFVRPAPHETNCSIGAYEYNSGISCGPGVCFFPQACVAGQCATPTPTLTPTSTPTVTPTATPTATPTNTPPAELIPGQGKSGCMLEWFTEPATAPGRNGLPAPQLTCTDDSPLCDFGATTGDHKCTFHVAVCLNVADTRLSSCTLTDVAHVQLLSPNEVKPKDPTATANRDALENALTGIGGTVGALCANTGPHKGQLCAVSSDCDSTPGSGNGVCKGRSVVFAPPLHTDNSCTAFAPIQVPLKQTTKGFKAASAMLSAKAISDAGKKGSNSLKLTCEPHS